MWIDRRWLITASVLLNIFLVGIVAGHALAERGYRVVRVGRQIVSAARVQALPPEEMQRFRDRTREHRATIRAARQALRAAQNKAEDAIGETTFDKTKIETALAAVRSAATAVQEAVHASLVDALGVLSPASRASLVAHHRATLGSKPDDDR